MKRRFPIKRLVSVGLVASMIAGLVYYGDVNQTIQKTDVYADSPTDITRGVVKNLSDLPQSMNSDYQNVQRGTKERPFVVLEVVPDVYDAEFGYLISGCEPVKIEDMYGDPVAMEKINSLGIAKIDKYSAYYFPDENFVGTHHAVSNAQTKTDVTVNGYYEMVADGTGAFTRKIEEIEVTITPEEPETPTDPDSPEEPTDPNSPEEPTDPNSPEEPIDPNSPEEPMEPEEPEETEELTEIQTIVTFEKNNQGNLVWHTVNDFEPEPYDGILYDDELSKPLTVGDRLYTTRTATAEDPINYIDSYYVYENQDVFLQDTLKLTEEQAAAYSIVVKTITPEELNSEARWIDYADLIVLSSKSHLDGFPDLYKKYVDTGVTINASANGFFAAGKDLNWSVVEKMYNKVTAETNYAGIVIDDAIYNNSSLQNVTSKILDWNMDDTGKTYTGKGSTNNVYKLCVMLMSMRSGLFKDLYIDSGKISNGENLLQKDAAKTCWSPATFMIVQSKEDANNAQSYWSQDYIWSGYGMTLTPSDTQYKNWVSEHVYTYPSDQSIVTNYAGGAGSNIPSGRDTSKFADFKSYVTTNGVLNAADSSDAIRFILQIDRIVKPTTDTVLHVLDLEPCVEVKYIDGSPAEPQWKLEEAYIRMLVPSFRGDIEITHMTTAEFNGNIEDLNSTYQMIYMGMDCGAYKLKNMNVTLNDGTILNKDLPDWVDTVLEGKIYLHTGDRTQGLDNQNFVYNPDSTSAIKNYTSKELRFPGNDITKLKMKDLISYAKSGYPIVAQEYLYNGEKALVDENAYVYKLMTKSEEATYGAYNIYNETNVFEIDRAVMAKDVNYDLTIWPKEYKANETNVNGQVKLNPDYLEKKNGRAMLDFVFTIDQPGYNYRLYIDLNANSKFEDNEIITSTVTSAVVGTNELHYPLSTKMIGLVQWKFEIYRADNPDEHYIKAGCSAIRNDSATKEEIRVLQIRPDGTCNWNLDTDTKFKKYYSNLADYTLKVDSITFTEFDKCFRWTGEERFKFDLSKEVDFTSNPVKASLDKVRDKFKTYAEGEGFNTTDLENYNMLVIGFADTYGKNDIWDKYGTMEYIQYYIAQGRGILLTHDLSSMDTAMDYGYTDLNGFYNADSSPFGQTTNMMLRDIMGMNVYGTVHAKLDEARRNQLIAYQQQHADNYTILYDTDGPNNEADNTQEADPNEKINTAADKATQGYTYLTVARRSKYGRSPYKAIVEAIGNYGLNTGYNHNTTQVEQINTGVITEYPYDVKEVLPVAKTHFQWYMLALEDEEVTVWYTLKDNGSQDSGNSIAYGVSPRDAANNYYIYSKGNIFYSGVGHSGVTGDDEIKLFVNTMIAAYRASSEPPEVLISNKEAISTGTREYTIEVPRAFNSIFDANNPNENMQQQEDFVSSDYKVYFTPKEYNLRYTATELKCKISYIEDGTNTEIPIETIYDSGGNPISADSNKEFRVEDNKQYYFVYENKYMDPDPATSRKSRRTVMLSIKNNKVSDSTTTTVKMSIEPLFQLD